MSARQLTDTFPMKKHTKRDYGGVKRRLIDEESTPAKYKGESSRSAVIEMSPIFQSQKEIVWNTVSPDCAKRLQPRVLDESQIEQDVINTIKSYVIADKKPRTSGTGILDSWLNKSEIVLPHPPTPKISERINRHRINRRVQNLAELQSLLENSTKQKQPVEQNQPAKLCEESEDVWSNEELFNDKDFLASTQQFEKKYMCKKDPKSKSFNNTKEESSNDDKEKSTNKSKEDLGNGSKEFSNKSKESSNGSREEQLNKKTVPNVLHAQGTANTVVTNTIETTVVYSVIKNKIRNECSELASTVDISNLNWEEDDDFDEVMCVMANDVETNFHNAATQVVDFDNGNELNTEEKAANNSFYFDSDDSFGADFDV